MPHKPTVWTRWSRYLLLLFALIPPLPGCSRGPAENERPNILWLTAEDMSANLGAYGDDYAVTPNLDRLARQGVTFANAYATAPVCSPARFALITGIYATTAGTQGLRARAEIPDHITGFPAYLRQLGYYTTNNVKTDYNTADEQRLIAEAWNESSATAHWRGRTPGQPFFAVFNHMHTHQTRISFLDTEFTELEGHLGRHDPAAAPLPPYYPDEPEVRQTIARYYDAITAMDENVGRLLAELEQDGLADDTIVFFYGDHGMGLPRGKRVLYDSGLRVPLIAYFPSKWEHLAPAAAGSTSDRMVSFIDFAPTVLSLAGAGRPEYMQGRVFLGEDAGEPRTEVVGARDRVDEAYDLARAVRDDRYLYIRHYHPHRSWNQPEYFSDQAAIRRAITRRAAEGRLSDAQRTYAGPTKPIEELFDTTADPHQIHNLAARGAESDVLARMRTRLREWQLETRDLGFMPESMALRLSTNGRTPMQLARDEAVYPLERVLETASLVGQEDVVAEQAARLRDENAVVRYWAAVGLLAAADAAAPVMGALRDALDDPAPEVRIAAAEALVKLNGSADALRRLHESLKSEESQIVLLAARTLQLLGPAAAPARGEMERVLAQAQDESTYGIDALFIRFALEPALSKPRGPSEVIEGPGRDMAPGSSSR